MQLARHTLSSRWHAATKSLFIKALLKSTTMSVLPIWLSQSPSAPGFWFSDRKIESLNAASRFPGQQPQDRERLFVSIECLNINSIRHFVADCEVGRLP